VIVYKLYHVRTRPDGVEDEKLIGIYTTEQKAKEAIQRAIGLPGFRDFPDGFKILEHLLDRDSWLEGFITAESASMA